MDESRYEEEYQRRFAEAQAAYEALPFDEKLAFANLTRKLGENHITTTVKWNGYLLCDEEHAIELGDGSHYVYIWKHAWGDPFYVGSGKGKRWVTKSPRNPDFYKHLDKGDAVVYKFVSGLDKSTSLAYEEYISVMLSSAGIELANSDNNVFGKEKDNRNKRIKKCSNVALLPETEKIQDELIKFVLNTERRADGHVTTVFLEECGTSYFSNYYHFNH